MAAPDTDTTPQIIAELYEARRLLRWHWRFRFIGLNGQKIGHEYNDLDNARAGLNLIVKKHVEVYARIVHRDGSVQEIGRIR